MPRRFTSQRIAQVIGCCLTALLAFGQATESLAQIPADKLLQSLRPAANVNDYAGILSPAEKTALEQRCRQLRDKNGAQLAVVVLQSLQGGQIDDFTVKLFKHWGIGEQGKNNGILLLVALDDRKARIEVGYGLEPVLPDALAGRILDQQLFPAFKQRRYYDGLQAAVGRIAEIIERNEPASAADRGQAFPPEAPLFLFLTLILAIFVAAGGFMLGRGVGFQDSSLIAFGLAGVGIPLLADCGMTLSWAMLLHVPIGLVLTWLGWQSTKTGTKNYWPGGSDVTTGPWMWGGTGGGWSDWSSGGSGGFSGGDWGGFGGGESGGGGASGGW